MKKLNIFLLAFTAVLFTGCTDEDKFPLDVENLETGAILRTIEQSTTFDFFNLSTSEFSVVLEADDGQQGELVENVEVFVRYDDRTPEDGGTDIGEVLIETIPVSAFTAGPDGLPRVSIDVTTPETLAALGLEESDLSPGDVFPFRLVLNLTTGQSFTSTNQSPDLRGSFYNSPFRYNVGVGCPLPSDKFTGDYQVTLVQGAGDFGRFSSTTFTATLSATTRTQRQFNFTYLPQIGGFNQTFEINFICFTTEVATHGTGLSCGGAAIAWASAGQSEPFDIADDSSFTVSFTDFVVDGGCGVGTYNVTLKFTKL